jgi:hypothetical protein
LLSYYDAICSLAMEWMWQCRLHMYVPTYVHIWNCTFKIFLGQSHYLRFNGIHNKCIILKLKFTTALLDIIFLFLIPWWESNPDRLLFKRKRWPLRHATMAVFEIMLPELGWFPIFIKIDQILGQKMWNFVQYWSLYKAPSTKKNNWNTQVINILWQYCINSWAICLAQTHMETKTSKKIPNDHKMYKMSIKYTFGP